MAAWHCHRTPSDEDADRVFEKNKKRRSRPTSEGASSSRETKEDRRVEKRRGIEIARARVGVTKRCGRAKGKLAGGLEKGV